MNNFMWFVTLRRLVHENTGLSPWFLCMPAGVFCFRLRCEKEGEMLVIVVKNINNNVSLCLDSRGKEVVVFGKGVGFVKPPAELPLSKIERSFYELGERYLSLLNDIPPEVIDFTARQMTAVQQLLPYETNSNLVMILADHLSFAMERAKKGIYVPMPSVYELESAYPLEIRISRQIVQRMEREFRVRLPKGEVQGVAMHFINARSGLPGEEGVNLEARYEEILERMTQIIEHELGLRVRRDTFSYTRFASHIQYLLKRVFEEQSIDSENVRMYEAIRSEYETVAGCVDRIAAYLESNWKARLSEEEKLYLIMHVNRVCIKELK